MTWALCLKRVLSIDFETYRICDAAVWIIAYIEDVKTIEKIRTHLDAKIAEPTASPRFGSDDYSIPPWEWRKQGLQPFN